MAEDYNNPDRSGVHQSNHIYDKSNSICDNNGYMNPENNVNSSSFLKILNLYMSFDIYDAKDQSNFFKEYSLARVENLFNEGKTLKIEYQQMIDNIDNFLYGLKIFLDDR